MAHYVQSFMVLSKSAQFLCHPTITANFTDKPAGLDIIEYFKSLLPAQLDLS